MNSSIPFQRCMVMAGGAFHFGYYLGAYAALCERALPPDILLASCGGAIAASIIQGLPTDAERKEWLYSPRMYEFWCSLKARQKTTLSGVLVGAAKRRISNDAARVIPDLFNDYMFEVGQLRGSRKLFAETIFCSERAAQIIGTMP